MKKVLFVVAIVLIVAMAGTALAGAGWKKQQGRDAWGKGSKSMVCGAWGANCLMPGGKFSKGFEVPQEIRDKMTEAQKIMIDLKAEFGKKPVNRETVLELHAKHFSLLQEISEWHINKQLDAAETTKSGKKAR
jgi:hypothetical protein